MASTASTPNAGRLVTALARGRRWLMRRLLGSSCVFVVGRRYTVHLPDSTFDPARAERILSFLLTERLTDERHVRRVQRAVSLRHLRRVHDDAYLDSIGRADGLTGIVGLTLTEAQQDAYVLSQRDQVNGTLIACRTALAGRGIVANLGGGFHHALAGRGQGFCVFNDVAVAIRERRAAGFEGAVLVIDLDVHDGDGTRVIFAEDETVHTFSIHNRTLDDTPAVASTTIELGSGVEDAAYLRAIGDHLPAVVERVAPELVVYLAGSDPSVDDRLGDWRVSADGLLARDRMVIRAVRGGGRELPLVILLAGGYGQNAWRYSARFLSTLATDGRAVEPPPTGQLRLEHFRRIARLMRPAELSHEPADSWQLTEEDIDPGAAARERSARFLGIFSRHGIELALERTGLFDKLRALGLGPLQVDIRHGTSGGQTLVVQSVAHGERSLMELQARTDRTTIAGMKLLWIEWLLLQNPAMPFTTERPALPGQRHPGLGMLGDVAALLVLIAERLSLDGVAFVPSHYHIAAQARSYFRFAEPEAQARFDELRRVLGGLRLTDAIARIERHEVRDAATGAAVAWIPATMIYPVRSRLRDELDGNEHARRVAAARERTRYRLQQPGELSPQDANG